MAESVSREEDAPVSMDVQKAFIFLEESMIHRLLITHMCQQSVFVNIDFVPAVRLFSCPDKGVTVVNKRLYVQTRTCLRRL